MLIGLRELQHHAKPGGLERLAYRLWAEVLKRPWLYRIALRLARLATRWRARDGWLSSLPGGGAGWTSVRDFPAPAPRSFRQRFQELS